MAATLVLRTVKGSPLTNYEVDNNFSNLNVFTSLVDSNVGVLTNLTTTAKGNIVAALNELKTTSSSSVTITGGTIANVSGSNVNVTSGTIANVSGSNVNITSGTISNVSGSNVNITSGTIAGAVISNSTWSGNTIAINKGGTNQTAFTSPSSSIQGLVFFNGTSLANDSNVYHVGYNDTSSTFYANIISTIGDITSGGIVSAVDFNSTSDETLKDNIINIINPMSILDQLSGKEFTWKSNGNKAYGLIAQDVEQVLPAIVSNNNGHKGINYINIIAFLVEAVKELSAEINILKQK